MRLSTILAFLGLLFLFVGLGVWTGLGIVMVMVFLETSQVIFIAMASLAFAAEGMFLMFLSQAISPESDARLVGIPYR